MPPLDDDLRLRHMLEAARKAVAFTEHRTREDLDADEQLALALTRLVEIIGEAAASVSGALKDLRQVLQLAAASGLPVERLARRTGRQRPGCWPADTRPFGN